MRVESAGLKQGWLAAKRNERHEASTWKGPLLLMGFVALATADDMCRTVDTDIIVSEIEILIRWS